MIFFPSNLVQLDLDPDLHSEKLLDPDLHKMNVDPQPCFKHLSSPFSVWQG